VRCAAVAVSVAVAGCASLAGPKYEHPAAPEKAQWSELEGRELTASEVIHPDWWTGFGDPDLDKLIDRAVNEGLDLKIAALRLDKAGVQLGKDRTQATPRVTSAPTDTIARQKTETTNASTVRETEALAFGVSWEIDIWGKIKKDIAAAEARYQATEMDWRATYLSLVSNVAQRYFEIRQFDEQIGQQVSSKQQAENLLDIYKAQHAEGMLPETRIRSQKAEVASLMTTLIELQRGRSEAELRLATLLGVPAGDFKVPAGGGLRERVRILEVPQMLPADMLSRRPDVLKAEYSVLEAYHLVGKARLARLPTFSLSGAAKTGQSFLSTFVNSWTFGLTSTWGGLFDRDLKIDVQLNEAQLKIAREEYRKAVLGAFEEVEVALLNLNAREEQMRELEKQVDDLKVVRDVQETRLKEGLISQLEVFDTERTLLSAQQQILSTYQLLLVDTLTLYKALGGGWPPEDVTKSPPRVAAETK
jgi:NodT family efflux transporter outer membrane factor (OMF) lipoprotein